MAENTLARNNALGATPIYGLPYTITFPFLDADGDGVSGATTPDAEISKNHDTAADCTNESTEIATSTGMYFLNLTGTEMTTDVASIFGKSATAGMKTTFAVLHPRKLPIIRSGTGASAGSSTSTIVLDSGASAIDDYYNGCVVSSNNDGTVEVRTITDYVGSTKTATVVPDWNLAPDNNDAFEIRSTDVWVGRLADVIAWQGTAVATPHTAGYPAVTIKDGTGTGEIDTTSGGVLVAAIAANAITATAINADAITAAKIADGAIDAATFAANAITSTVVADNAITANKIATGAIAAAKFAAGAIDAAAIANGAIDAATFAAGAIDAAALAADAGTEIGTAVWATTTRSLTILDEDSTTIDIDNSVWGGGTRTLTALDEDSTTLDLDATIRAALGMSSANLDTQLGDLPTAAENADAVWDEAIAGHLGAGSTGEALDNAGAAGTPPTAAEIADAVWDEATSGHTTSGTFGEQAKTDIDGILTAIAALNNLSGSAAFTAVLRTQLTEAYASNGVAPTLEQALFAVHQHLMNFSIAGTQRITKKLDGSSTAFIGTLDDAVSPTGAVRA